MLNDATLARLRNRVIRNNILIVGILLFVGFPLAIVMTYVYLIVALGLPVLYAVTMIGVSERVNGKLFAGLDTDQVGSYINEKLSSLHKLTNFHRAPKRDTWVGYYSSGDVYAYITLPFMRGKVVTAQGTVMKFDSLKSLDGLLGEIF